MTNDPNALPPEASREFACDGLILDGFRVWSFRAVRDSGYVPISSITALVGREQSGKTALLHALGGLDPRIVEPFSPEHDWPRGRRPQPSGSQVVCAAKLRFAPPLRDELVNLGLITSEAAGIHLGRTFANGYFMSVLAADAFARPLVHSPERGSESTRELQGALLPRLPELLSASPDSILPDKFPSSEIEALLRGGQFPLSRLADKKSWHEGAGLRALATLALVGEPRKEAREEATQHGHPPADWRHRINARLERLALSQELRLTEDRGLIRVLSRRRGAWRPFGLLPPTRRYLATLDLRIAAIEEAGGPAPMLLLDAPGKAFKGGFKRQLRSSLERYADAGIRVIYTARLPFHIELQHPEQVLVLAPSDVAETTLCEVSHPPGELALQASLGMQGRSSFRIDDVNLVVEGPTDAGILRALATLFAASGEPSLPEDLNIISAGGAFEVASVAAFLARQGLGVVALFDSDAAGLAGRGQLEASARDERFRRSVTPLLLGEAAGLEVEDATIEDLFPASEYLEAFRDVADEGARRLLGELEVRMERAGEQHVARWIRKAFEARGRRFPKVEIAEALENRLLVSASTADLDPGFHASISALFKRMGDALEAEALAPGES